MKSLSVVTGSIILPILTEKHSMIPFDMISFRGLPKQFSTIAKKMLNGIKHNGGTAFFTLHGRKVTAGNTLRRGSPHIDGNYEAYNMSFGTGGGNGWKVGETGPDINTELHSRQYIKSTGGIIVASNFESCLGWNGDYEGTPKKGGDCRHIKLDDPFMLEKDKIYYGNNHFIHESIPVTKDVHRVFARITLPEDHKFNF